MNECVNKNFNIYQFFANKFLSFVCFNKETKKFQEFRPVNSANKVIPRRHHFAN